MTDDHATDSAATDPPAPDTPAPDGPGASAAGTDRPGGSRDRQTDRDRPDDVETSVPADAPVFRCSYCGRPFATEQYLALHLGLAHLSALTHDERAAYETAFETETADIRRFRILALGGLVALYFGLLFAYAAFA